MLLLTLLQWKNALGLSKHHLFFFNLGDHLYEQMTRVISLLNSEVTSIPGTRNMVSAATFKDILDLKLDLELI